MPFSSYRNLSETLKEFQITYTEKNFIQAVPFEVSDYFRSDLRLMMEEGVVDNSEYAICENLIYPILKEVWKQYRKHFILWSHEYLNVDTKLSGFPEYILARRWRSLSDRRIAARKSRFRSALLSACRSQAGQF